MISRRNILGAALLLPLEGLAQTCGSVTPRQTEGPFFKTDTPLRTSFLEKGSSSRFLLAGSVLSRNCQLVPNALLEFWHADEDGAYDNRGYRYRGHQHADAQGRYRLETIVPALYPGRARHIHVKVQAPNRRILTTQLYFPGDARDGLWRSELEVAMARRPEGRVAVFQFIVDA